MARIRRLLATLLPSKPVPVERRPIEAIGPVRLIRIDDTGHAYEIPGIDSVEIGVDPALGAEVPSVWCPRQVRPAQTVSTLEGDFILPDPDPSPVPGICHALVAGQRFTACCGRALARLGAADTTVEPGQRPTGPRCPQWTPALDAPPPWWLTSG